MNVSVLSAPPDSGTPTDEAGPADAGTPLEDAATPTMDAATPPDDAGTPPSNTGGSGGGEVSEAGAVAAAGSANASGGASDSSPSAGDAGKPDTTQPAAAPSNGGCSCDVARSNHSPSLGFLGLSLLMAAQLRSRERRKQRARFGQR